jgi:hypothetical protein
MGNDAISGATYKDRVFADRFTITDITPDEVDSHDPSDIVLTLEYEVHGEIVVTLEQFRSDECIELCSVPEAE